MKKCLPHSCLVPINQLTSPTPCRAPRWPFYFCEILLHKTFSITHSIKSIKSTFYVGEKLFSNEPLQFNRYISHPIRRVKTDGSCDKFFIFIFRLIIIICVILEIFSVILGLNIIIIISSYHNQFVKYIYIFSMLPLEIIGLIL